jgi:hypothetical protein
LKGPGDGRDLVEDLDAVPLFVHHTLQATHLALNAAKPFSGRVLLVDVTGHRGSIPEEGILPSRSTPRADCIQGSYH